MKKEWHIKLDGRDIEQEDIIDEILESRGIDDAVDFLNPSEDEIIPLEKLRNIDKAADIILNGIENEKTFYVHFDVDVDGVSSGSIAYRYLDHFDADIRVGINEGKKHGIAGFDVSELKDVDILWIVDSIQNSIEDYKRIADTGVQIVITDHHIVSPDLQKQMEEIGIVLVSSAVDYENPNLSGSSTTWKLCKYIDYMNLDDFADDLVDLAAAGLVSDMCSMASMENRAICNKAFRNLRNPGIKKMNGTYSFVARNISFGVAPKINAANRMNHNDLAMRIFLSNDTDEIASIVKELDKCRKQQNEIVDELMPCLEEQIEEQKDNKCMFLFIPNETEASVSGLIGNKILERVQRPLMVLKKHKDEYAGSMRAIGVKSFKEYFDNVGIGWCSGHKNAAGVGIPIERFDEFKEKILEELKDIEFVCETTADIQLDICQITEDLIKKLNYVNRISGNGFEPITVMVETDDYDVQWMSGGKHLKIVDNESGVIFVKWNYNGDRNFNGTLSAIGQLEFAHYGRNNYKQLTMQDFKFGDS